jgi:hypothetical protein
MAFDFEVQADARHDLPDAQNILARWHFGLARGLARMDLALTSTSRLL